MLEHRGVQTRSDVAGTAADSVRLRHKQVKLPQRAFSPPVQQRAHSQVRTRCHCYQKQISNGFDHATDNDSLLNFTGLLYSRKEKD